MLELTHQINQSTFSAYVISPFESGVKFLSKYFTGQDTKVPNSQSVDSAIPDFFASFAIKKAPFHQYWTAVGYLLHTVDAL